MMGRSDCIQGNQDKQHNFYAERSTFVVPHGARCKQKHAGENNERHADAANPPGFVAKLRDQFRCAKQRDYVVLRNLLRRMPEKNEMVLVACDDGPLG